MEEEERDEKGEEMKVLREENAQLKQRIEQLEARIWELETKEQGTKINIAHLAQTSQTMVEVVNANSTTMLEQREHNKFVVENIYKHSAQVEKMNGDLKSVIEVLKIHHNQIQCDGKTKEMMAQYINAPVQENAQQKLVLNTITQEVYSHGVVLNKHEQGQQVLAVTVRAVNEKADEALSQPRTKVIIQDAEDFQKSRAPQNSGARSNTGMEMVQQTNTLQKQF